MQNLLWLIEQAPRFGVSAVARSADETVGALCRASADVKDPALVGRWTKRFVSFVAAVGLLTTGVTAGQQLLEASAGSLRAVESSIRAADGVVGAVQDFGDDQSQPDKATP